MSHPGSAPCHQLGCLPPHRASKPPSAFPPLAFWPPVLQLGANQSISPERLWDSCQSSFLWLTCLLQCLSHSWTQGMSEWMNEWQKTGVWLVASFNLPNFPPDLSTRWCFVLFFCFGESHLLFLRLLSKLEFPAATEEKEEKVCRSLWQVWPMFTWLQKRIEESLQNLNISLIFFLIIFYDVATTADIYPCLQRWTLRLMNAQLFTWYQAHPFDLCLKPLPLCW